MGCKPNSQSINKCIQISDLNKLKWLYLKNTKGLDNYSIFIALKNHNFEIIDFLNVKNRFDDIIIKLCINLKDSIILQWILNKNMKIEHWVVEYANKKNVNPCFLQQLKNNKNH